MNANEALAGDGPKAWHTVEDAADTAKPGRLIPGTG